MKTLQTIWTDVRYALKSFVRSPEFAGVAILSLAIGIGINTAVFSVFNAVLLRPFPYEDPDRLAMLFETNTKSGGTGVSISPPDFLSWRQNARTLQSAAAYREWEPNLTGIEQAEQLSGLRVSGDFFTLLGVQPVAGRALVRDDETMRNRVAVISRDLYRRLFALDPRIVGSTVRLDGESYVVAGVMPDTLQLPHRSIEIWAPLNLDAERNDRAEHSLRVVARLAPGASFAQARSELRGLMVEHEAESGGHTADLAGLREWFVGRSSKRTLWLLLGAVSLLLVTACANVANLLLARGSGRARELMVRTAIGASRARLVSQLITESLALAAVAGVLALFFAAWSTEAIARILPGTSAFHIAPFTLDWRVLTYSAIASLLSGVIFGVLPAFRYSRTDLRPERAGATVTSFRLRAVLLVTQAALAVVLLAGAGLLGRTFLNIWRIDPGFSSGGVTAARITLPGREPDAAKTAFFAQVVDRLSANPQLSAAGAVTHVPMSGGGNSNYVTIEGREALSMDPSTRPGASRLIVMPGYFKALAIPIRSGRTFTDADATGSEPVVIINEAMARRYWPDQDPLGRRLKRGTPQAPFAWLRIVGVVSDMQQFALGGQAVPTIYLPLRQSAESAMTLVVKSDRSRDVVAAEIRAAVRGANRDQPIAWIRSLDQIVFGSIETRWLPVLWMMLFAGAALFLATLGVYGVVSYAVEQRRREFGIRLALGAARGNLIRLALRQGVVPASVGVLVGLAAAVALARVNARFFAGIQPLDAAPYAGAAALLFLVSAVASYLPARRIASDDASLALRSE
jgi:putative ABC transport system permease protein